MLAEQDAKLNAILDELHAVRRLLHKMAVPVACLDKATAAKQLGVSVKTLERITAGGVFTDGRAPERRIVGAARVYYADELDVYRTEGAEGVERLRKQLGRA